MYFGESVVQSNINESYIGDINYFDTSYIDSLFRSVESIQDINSKSKELSKILYDIIQNIGATCTKAIKINDLYKKGYKYNHIITKYYNKYINNIIEDDRIKIKKAVDEAFVGDPRDSLVKLAVGIVTDFIVPKEFKFISKAYEKFNDSESKSFVRNKIVQLSTIFYMINKDLKMKKGMSEDQAKNVADAAGKKAYNKMINKVNDSKSFVTGIVRSIPKSIISSIFFNICPVKFRSIGQALVVYKQSSKYNKFLSDATKEGAKYCFDLTYAVMEDIMKVYKDL